MIDATLWPTVPLHIDVRGDGLTVEAPGTRNVRRCLASDGQRVTDLMMRRMLVP